MVSKPVSQPKAAMPAWDSLGLKVFPWKYMFLGEMDTNYHIVLEDIRKSISEGHKTVNMNRVRLRNV